MPTSFNHIGDDLCRGLLKFGSERPLGATGLRWLKIHVANKFGFDKASFDERVQFTEDHMKEIKDSAEHPLSVSLKIKDIAPSSCLLGSTVVD